MIPAGIIVLLFFLIPVFLTVVFSFTTMGSETGITGNRYVISEVSLRKLKDSGLRPAIVKKLGSSFFIFNETGIEKIKQTKLNKKTIKEIKEKLAGTVFSTEKELFKALKRLKNRPRSFKDRKTVSKAVAKTIKNKQFFDAKDLQASFKTIDLEVTDEEFDLIRDITNTSWKWTTGNYREMFASQFTLKILFNTFFYLFFTMFFNVGYALLLAIATFYMPEAQSKFFRAIWLLPRITPAVIYVMLWKWFSYDKGFLSSIFSFAGIPGQNWLMEFPWTFVIVINGFVGASMGMIIFASAIEAIPKDILYAAEVDGAYVWQQVRRIVLPLMAWPILFITSYQSLSLLTSYEYILLSTNGGPGFYTTETWALNAFHTALNNYFGNLRYGYGATLAVVLVILGIGLSLIYLRFFKFKELVTEPLIENY